MSNRDRLVLASFCIVAPIAYAYITQLWRDASLLTPIPALHNVAFTYAIAFAVESIGAGIAALTLSLPLVWLVKRRPLFIAACLTMASAVTLLPDLLLFGIRLGVYKYAAIQVPALIAFFIISWLVAELVRAYRPQSAA